MLIRRAPDIKSSEITPEALYFGRREFIRAASAAAVGLAAPAVARAAAAHLPDDKPNSYDDITHYNNFYEFGTGRRTRPGTRGR